jgi:hypothetical protein
LSQQAACSSTSNYLKDFWNTEISKSIINSKKADSLLLFTTMSALNKAANIVQKGSVLGLLSLFGYQVYQIGAKVSEKKIQTKYDNTDMMKKINEKVEEEAKDRHSIDKIPDRYDPDDNSYLKRVPNLKEPVKQDS